MTLQEILPPVLAFIATFLFVSAGINVFSKGLDAYGKRYMEEAENSMRALYLSLTPQQVLYLSLAGSLVILVLVFAVTQNIVLSILLCIPSFFIPRVVIHWMKKRRLRKLNMQLVDALVMMGNALKAGLSLNQAMQLIPREMDDPIRREFRILTRQIQLGMSEEEALRDFYERAPLEDVDLFVTAVIVSRNIGGNLTEVLENIAETIRERFRIEGRIRALTAQGKAQGIVMCILPLIAGAFIHMFNPEWMRPLFTTIWGMGMIALIIVLEILGGFFIYRIVSIDV